MLLIRLKCCPATILMTETRRSGTIIVISMLTVAVSLLVMTGWICAVPSFEQVIPGFVAMVFNSALCFTLFAGALLIRQFYKGKNSRLIFFVLSLGGTFIGFVTLLELLFHFNAGIDEAFVTDPQKTSADHLYAGRMAYNTAICFSLLGLGMLLVNLGNRSLKILAQYLFHAVSILSAVALIGYLYGVSLFNTLFYVSSMATHTAILFLFISIAASLVNPQLGITRLFTGELVGNQMAKRLFVLIVLMVLIFGSIRGQTQHAFSLDIGISLLAVSFLLMSLFIIWNTANWLNRIDSKRSEAEAEVKRMNAELEKRVDERSAEIQKSEARYRSLIEQASDAIYVVDFKGNFIEVNNAICRMTGYSREELLQMNVEQIIDPEELRTDPIKHGPRNQNEYGMRERRLMRKDGAVFPSEVNVKMFPDDKILVIARDITDRKLTEELALREKLLSDTIINSLPGIFYLQNKEGSLLRWNKNLEQALGYGSTELFGKNVFDMIAEEDREVIANARETAFKEGYVMVESRAKLKDGTKVPFLFTGIAISYEDQECLLGTGIDISSRVTAEEELRASEQKYRLLFDSNPVPLWMISRDNMTIIDVNNAAAIQYGYTRDELLNQSVLILRPADDRERELAGSVGRAQEYPVDGGVVKHLKKDGTPMFVHIIAHDIVFEGRPVRLSFTNDITERLKAEELLQKSEANMQTIFRTTNIIFATLSKDLEILAFNPKAAEFVDLHYKRTLEKGQRMTDYMSPERAPQVMSLINRVLNGKSVSYEINYRGHWYTVNFSPIVNDQKEILGMLLTMDEITARKNVEQNLKDAYDQIQSQINSIKDMAWKQSHLIRSPLANLKALTAILHEDPADRTTLDHIQNELDRMDTIIIEMAEEASGHDE